METKTTEKISKFKRLYQVMEKNLDKWGDIEQFRISYDEFVHNLKKIDDLELVARKDLNGLKLKLESCRNNIITKLIPVTNLLTLYALDNNKKGLRKKMDKSRKNLESLKNKALIDHVAEVSDYLQKKFNKQEEKAQDDQLGSYGLSMDLIGKLRTDRDELVEIKEQLHNENEQSEKSNKEVNQLVAQNEKLIKERFDVFMSIFEFSNPAFFNSYQNAMKTPEATKPVTRQSTPRSTNRSAAAKTTGEKTTAKKAAPKSRAKTTARTNTK